MNSFNLTEAYIFPLQAIFLDYFPFFPDYVNLLEQWLMEYNLDKRYPMVKSSQQTHQR